MAKDSGAIRMNISVQSDLKSRMDAEDVNWSAVAAAAFEAKLVEISATKLKGKTMTDVIERMKAAEKLDADQGAKEGKEMGESWAKESATPRQLRKLFKDVEAVGTDAGYEDINTGNSVLAGVLCSAISMDKDFSLRDIESYPDFENYGVTLDTLGDLAFVEAFIDGAASIWSKVEDKI